jgi:hypothetical protein
MKIPLKFPVAESAVKTFMIAPRSLCQTEGDRSWAKDAAVKATRNNKAASSRYTFFSSLRSGKSVPFSQTNPSRQRINLGS